TMIPPLSKSLQRDLSCESLYVAKHIDEVPEIISQPALRGTEIHETILAYVQRLIATKQQSDYDFLRKLASTLSEESREIIETFSLDFVRYGIARRSVEFTRADVKKLKDTASRERLRQVALYHRLDREFSAIPGRHCAYCPLLMEGCPLSKVNPYSALTPEQR